MFSRSNRKEGLSQSIITAHVILILHVALIALIGFLILLFGGIINHMVWVITALLVLICVSGYLIFRRLRKSGKTIAHTLNASPFHGRPVEVSFLNGLASLKLGGSEVVTMIDHHEDRAGKQLEDPTMARIRELNELGKLLEGGHITTEEFHRFKQQIFGS